MRTLVMTLEQATERVRAVCASLERWHWDPTPQAAAVLLAALPVMIGARTVNADQRRVERAT